MAPHQANLIDYTNKVIIEETPLYALFGPQWDTTPGFFLLEPKVPGGNRRIWIQKVIEHLRLFSDPYNYKDFKVAEPEITYQDNHRMSFLYQGGFVGVYPEKLLIEISQAHPNRENVIHALIKLKTIAIANQRQHGVGTSPTAKIIIANQ